MLSINDFYESKYNNNNDNNSNIDDDEELNKLVPRTHRYSIHLRDTYKSKLREERENAIENGLTWSKDSHSDILSSNASTMSSNAISPELNRQNKAKRSLSMSTATQQFKMLKKENVKGTSANISLLITLCSVQFIHKLNHYDILPTHIHKKLLQ